MVTPATMEKCFAFSKCVDNPYGRCTALNVRYCEGFEDCPFYKPKSQNDAELIKYNGTTNLVEIFNYYADGHQGIYKGVPDSGYNLCAKEHDADERIVELWNAGYNRAQIATELCWDKGDVINRLTWLYKHGYIKRKKDMK